MNRRDAIQGMTLATAAAILAGCWDTVVTRRVKLIATAEVDGQKITGETVMELKWRSTNSGRMYESEKGEALILELAGRGTVYILAYTMAPDGNTTSGLTQNLVNQAAGVKWATARKEELPLIEAVQGRYTVKPYHKSRLVHLMVAFKDETRKDTIFEVKAEDFSKYFGATVKFVGLEFELTDEPITEELVKRLPMLKQADSDNRFPRDPPGKGRPYDEVPFAYKMSENKFFRFGEF